MTKIVIARKKTDEAGKTSPGDVIANGYTSALQAHQDIGRLASKRRLEPVELGVFADGKFVPHAPKQPPFAQRTMR